MRQTREEWAKHVGGWRASGLTGAAYCEAEKLKLSKLRYWSSQLLKEQKASAKRTGFARVRRQTQQVSREKLPPVTPLQVWCGEMKVEVPSGFDAATLSRLLNILRGAGQ